MFVVGLENCHTNVCGITWNSVVSDVSIEVALWVISNHVVLQSLLREMITKRSTAWRTLCFPELLVSVEELHPALFNVEVLRVARLEVPRSYGSDRMKTYKFVAPLLFLTSSFLLAQETPVSSPVATAIEGEPMARGPIHEAFAEPLALDDQKLFIAPKAPPEKIEERPPKVPSDGKNMIWIPGYWAWDDEREDYIWVSGVWRNVPQGRSWVPGLWEQLDGGYRWSPGYWGPANTQAQHVPTPPPESLESGPTSEPASDDVFWIPGCWRYLDQRYVWRPGFWSPCHDNWVWVPDNYVYGVSGCRYVSGYWDYGWEHRGTLYAPAYIDHVAYARPGCFYTPSVVIDVVGAFSHLWVRPQYCHYYFGDYYDIGYVSGGYWPWYSYHRPYWRKYDPLYVHYRWKLGRDRIDIHRHFRHRHDHYRRHVDDRPDRLYRDHGRGKRNNVRHAKNALERASWERQQLARRAAKNDLQRSRTQRSEDFRQAMRRNARQTGSDQLVRRTRRNQGAAGRSHDLTRAHRDRTRNGNRDPRMQLENRTGKANRDPRMQLGNRTGNGNRDPRMQLGDPGKKELRSDKSPRSRGRLAERDSEPNATSQQAGQTRRKGRSENRVLRGNRPNSGLATDSKDVGSDGDLGDDTQNRSNGSTSRRGDALANQRSNSQRRRPETRLNTEERTKRNNRVADGVRRSGPIKGADQLAPGANGGIQIRSPKNNVSSSSTARNSNATRSKGAEWLRSRMQASNRGGRPSGDSQAHSRVTPRREGGKQAAVSPRTERARVTIPEVSRSRENRQSGASHRPTQFASELRSSSAITSPLNSTRSRLRPSSGASIRSGSQASSSTSRSDRPTVRRGTGTISSNSSRNSVSRVRAPGGSGAAKSSAARSGAARSSAARSGAARSSAARSSAVRSSAVRSSAVRSSAARSGAARSGAARSGAARSGAARSGNR